MTDFVLGMIIGAVIILCIIFLICIFGAMIADKEEAFRDDEEEYEEDIPNADYGIKDKDPDE